MPLLTFQASSVSHHLLMLLNTKLCIWLTNKVDVTKDITANRCNSAELVASSQPKRPRMTTSQTKLTKKLPSSRLPSPKPRQPMLLPKRPLVKPLARAPPRRLSKRTPCDQLTNLNIRNKNVVSKYRLDWTNAWLTAKSLCFSVL